MRSRHPGNPGFDLRYFCSAYFREPGGAVLGLAIDPPGFTVDEPAGALGRRLTRPYP